MGLFGIGNKKRIQDLYLILTGKPDTPMTRKQPMPPEADVMKAVTDFIATKYRQIDGQLPELESSFNPRSFYDAVDYVRGGYDLLARYEAVDAKLVREKTAAALKKLDKAIPKQETAMWERYFEQQAEKAKLCKTAAGKVKHMADYFDDVNLYIARLGDGAKKAIEKHRKTAVKKYGYEG